MYFCRSMCLSGLVALLVNLISVVSVHCVEGPVSSSKEHVFIITTTSSESHRNHTNGSASEYHNYNKAYSYDASINRSRIVASATRHKRDVGMEPEIYSFRIQSDIRYRYSTTHVTSRVVNKDVSLSKEVVFRAVLPETAYISKFIMEIDGVKYESFVKEKEEARRVYNEARNRGESAGLVALNSRHSNTFNVNVNIRAQSKITFNLTYEELLTRKLGCYEQIINISPEQISHVKDFQIIVNIEETQNVTFLQVPNLRNDIEAEQDAEGNNKDARIDRPAGNRANIFWSPSVSDQTTLSKQGIVGKFVVQYDINRNSKDGEVLIMQGYFVHFFAPADLKSLRKHVIFILDISGSMRGGKMEQMKESQNKILEDLSDDDFFNIIIFSTDVIIYSSTADSKTMPIEATNVNIAEAKRYINSLEANGGTNIHGAIISALELTASIRKSRDKTSNRTILPENVESLIIFLTDGEPTIGISDPSEIQSRIQVANKKLSVCIFSLAFGGGANFQFLRKLSLQNYGFARKIYEASDSVLQLKGFYKEISSPLLSNVRFQYTSPEYRISDVTTTTFQTMFKGSEIAVAGKLAPLHTSQRNTSLGELGPSTIAEEMSPVLEKHHLEVKVVGLTREGFKDFTNPEIFSRRNPWGVIDVPAVSLEPSPSPEDQFLERLWAYLTVKQLIDKDLAGIDTDKMNGEDSSSDVQIAAPKETSKEQALRLALKYSFVTSLTSLVVVKPDERSSSSQLSAGVTNLDDETDHSRYGNGISHHPTSSKGRGKGPLGQDLLDKDLLDQRYSAHESISSCATLGRQLQSSYMMTILAIWTLRSYY